MSEHRNDHRKGKVSFQVMLRPDDAAVVDQVKEIREFKNSRELLVTLCKEELERHGD